MKTFSSLRGVFVHAHFTFPASGKHFWGLLPCWFGVNETGIDVNLIPVEKSSAAREKNWENIDFSPPSLRSAHERELPFLSRFIAIALSCCLQSSGGINFPDHGIFLLGWNCDGVNVGCRLFPGLFTLFRKNLEFFLLKTSKGGEFPIFRFLTQKKWSPKVYYLGKRKGVGGGSSATVKNRKALMAVLAPHFI